MMSKIEPQWEELGSTSPTPEDAIEVFVDGYKNPKGDDRSTGLRGRRHRNSQILLPQPPLHCRKLPYVPCQGREVAQACRFLHHARSSRLMDEAIADERFQDTARYRDELKDIAPHSLLKCSSDATTLVCDLVTGRFLQTRVFPLPIIAIVVDPTKIKLFSSGIDC
ncbi:hypothetical protein CsSME_00024766 [Camellia sinensis var. sinensis]